MTLSVGSKNMSLLLKSCRHMNKAILWDNAVANHGCLVHLHPSVIRFIAFLSSGHDGLGIYWAVLESVV